MFNKSGRLVIAAATALAVTATASEAGRYKRSYDEGSYVVAESVSGNGRVAGRVRHTRMGPQVQLPGGNWIYCRRSCSETLRVSTVDFWESDEGAGSRNSTTNETGIFGNLGIYFNR